MDVRVSYLGRKNVTENDIARVWELLQLMHAEVGLFSLSEEKVRAKIDNCLDHGYVAVVKVDELIVATMGVETVQPWYSEEWHFNETWTFVHPDHRRSIFAKALLSHAIEGAATAGRPIVLGVFTTARTEGKCRLLRRQPNLRQVGAAFLGGA